MLGGLAARRRVTGRTAIAALTILLLVGLIIFLSGAPLHFRWLLPATRLRKTAHAPLSIENTSRQVIRALWFDDWAKMYIDARPPPGKIELLSRYENVAVPLHDQMERQAARERVSSSKQFLDEIGAAHAKFVHSLGFASKAQGIFRGKGVVTMGGGEYYGPAVIQIRMLRKTGSNLPVEVFLKDQSEYEECMCEQYLPKLGATCVVIDRLLNSTLHSLPPIEHYQLKLLAALFSSFEDILFLDSDNIPLVDPMKELFSTEPYLSSGFVTWPDFWAGTESPSFYTVAGMGSFPSNVPKRSSESGQVLINKRTHMDTLLLALYYNIYGPDIYYPLLSQGAIGQGDKETLLAASIVLSQPYYRVKTPVRAVERDTSSIKISGMIQHLPPDDLKNTISPRKVRPAFVHSNTPKMNAGHLVDEGDLFNNGKRLRLWGSAARQVDTFGRDVEKEVWALLVETGCELADKIAEWRVREDMCKRLKAHWEVVFAAG